jgi:SAM-dependent methyltransferase
MVEENKMKNGMTIIYYTDNSLEPTFEKTVQEYLVEAADGKPIVSVSQKPLSFGENICVGNIGRSHHSLFSQALAGAEAAETRYMALAEHDCLYTREHFSWVPPRDDLFYYNINHWFVQWNNKLEGQYSFFRRKPLSMLVCNRELFIEAVKEKLLMLKFGAKIRKGQVGACEPGVCDNRQSFVNLQAAMRAAGDDVGKGDPYRAAPFKTRLPNIDIRYGGNFSGARRTKKTTYSIPYWGSFHKVMKVPPPGNWYQDATINGVKMPAVRRRDTSHKRWETFIRPHLSISENNETFLDLGCNAGFYCRQATDIGFKSIGIEKDLNPYRQALYWESCEPKGVRFVHDDICECDIPKVDVALMSCVHYWLTDHELKGVERTLRGRAKKVIVMARRRKAEVHASSPVYDILKKRFENWTCGRLIKSGMHYSVVFTNTSIGNTEIVKVDDIFKKQQLARSRFYSAFGALVKTGDVREYVNYLKWRGFPKERANRQIKLIQDIKKNGIQNPLVMEGDRVVDGDHRLIIAKILGIKKVIVQRS